MNERLAELRNTLDLTMEKFGSRIGISRSGISKMENGSSGLSEQTVLSICREYHVNYFWLTEGKGEMFTDTPRTIIEKISEEYNLDELDQKILTKFLELKPEERKIIKDYMKSIFT